MSDSDELGDMTARKSRIFPMGRSGRRLLRSESVQDDSSEIEYVFDDRPSPLAQTEKLRRQQRLREPHLLFILFFIVIIINIIFINYTIFIRRKKMVLQRESTLPWEFDTARFASQRGSGAFGSIRNAGIFFCCLKLNH
jgi:hypothetical protein